jgi:hypothetical protein
VFRIELDTLIAVCDGMVILTLANIDQAAVVVGANVFGVELNGLVAVNHCAIKLALVIVS